MEVFGVGPLEIALVVLIAFIVLGPDRIPGTMRQLGRWTRQLREMVNNITRDYNTEIREITGEITALQEEIRSIQRDLGGIATGFMSTTFPTESTPPARSNTAAPADPLGADQSISPRSSAPSAGSIDGVSAPPAPPAAAESGAGESYSI
jgi:sec-independent protein translocase protein TatB